MALNVGSIVRARKIIDEFIDFKGTNKVSFDISIGYTYSSFHDIISRGINDVSGFVFNNSTLIKLYEDCGEGIVKFLLEEGYEDITFGNLDDVEYFIKAIDLDSFDPIFIMKDKNKTDKYIVYGKKESGDSEHIKQEVEGILDGDFMERKVQSLL